ncbi:MAG: hypothetical protein KA408_09965 [Flavobacteriales bacterium]|jgi:hypothetical protein|nr:hypothetical protein [Flavobacteriales bacterium]
MTRLLLIILLSLVALVNLTSCKKEKCEETPPIATPAAISTYSNLDAGNYWVYQKYKVDSTGAILETLGMDSIWVAGDSTLTTGTYAALYRSISGNPSGYARFWRDSLTYLVTSEHEVIFCTDPLDEVIYSPNPGPVGVSLDYTVYSTPESIAVPAGTFTCNMMRAEIMSVGGYPEQPDWKRPRSYWAEGVGRVQYFEFYGAMLEGFRYDLVRYNVD